MIGATKKQDTWKSSRRNQDATGDYLSEISKKSHVTNGSRHSRKNSNHQDMSLEEKLLKGYYKGDK